MEVLTEKSYPIIIMVELVFPAKANLSFNIQLKHSLYLCFKTSPGSSSPPAGTDPTTLRPWLPFPYSIQISLLVAVILCFGLHVCYVLLDSEIPKGKTI